MDKILQIKKEMQDCYEMLHKMNENVEKLFQEIETLDSQSNQKFKVGEIVKLTIDNPEQYYMVKNVREIEGLYKYDLIIIENAQTANYYLNNIDENLITTSTNDKEL